MPRPTPDADRPWSEDEVLVELAFQKDRLEDAVASLKALGMNKAETADRFDRAMARWMLQVRTEHPDLKSDAMRQNWIIDNTDVWDLHLEKDKAETIYKDQATTVAAIRSVIDALRSMLRSARDNVETGGYGAPPRR